MVNDSPALKRADVGFAMGSGTEAAKEAGDLVIIDDNFLSIRNAILYGRTIYNNIMKFVRFQLSINVAAVLTSAVAPFLGVEEPLTVTHLLFVNLVMDSLGALLLGQEPALAEYMQEKPKRRDQSIITKNIFVQFVTMGLYLFGVFCAWFFSGVFEQFFMVDGVLNEAQFKTGFFAVFMFSAIINGFNVRNDGFNIFLDMKDNKNFMPVLGAMLLATFALCMSGVILQAIGQMFSTTPITLVQWLVVIAVALLIIPVDMVRKLVFGTYKHK